VELQGVALGKPTDEADAYRMLRSLSGKAHNVHTGVAVHCQGRVFSGVATTAVHFREMTDEEIYDYIATGDPMDKAGAYGIQNGGGLFVTKYDGDYDTVVGLSVKLTKSLIDEATK
jgi:septum formation protein